jgi:hypothetical protein
MKEEKLLVPGGFSEQHWKQRCFEINTQDPRTIPYKKLREQVE